MGTPLLETEGLARLLSQTDLRGATCEARRIAAGRRPPMIVIHQLPGTDVLAAWRRLRGLLPRTGRYPVIVDAAAEDLGLDEARERALRNATLIDLEREPRLRCAGVDAEQVRLRAELAQGPRLASGAPEPVPPAWSHPEPQRRYAIALPPASTMWEAALQTPWRGIAAQPDLVAAVLRCWERRFGAELMIALPDRLKFTVRRPPVTLNEAFAVAVQQRCLGGNVAPLSTLREDARRLLSAERWSLVAA